MTKTEALEKIIREMKRVEGKHALDLVGLRLYLELIEALAAEAAGSFPRFQAKEIAAKDFSAPLLRLGAMCVLTVRYLGTLAEQEASEHG